MPTEGTPISDENPYYQSLMEDLRRSQEREQQRLAEQMEAERNGQIDNAARQQSPFVTLNGLISGISEWTTTSTPMPVDEHRVVPDFRPLQWLGEAISTQRQQRPVGESHDTKKSKLIFKEEIEKIKEEDNG